MRGLQAARGTAITDAVGADSDGATNLKAPRTRYRLLFAGVLLLGILLDVVTKTLAVTYLNPQQPVRLLGGLLHLQLIKNPGAAFSLGENFTIVFTVLSAVVLLFVIVVLAPRIGHSGWAVALGLIAAGVGGNFIDRLFRAPSPLHGHVVDFLQLPRWPIFNVADMCITSAAVLIMILSVIKNVAINGQHYQKPPPAEKKTSSQPPTDS